MAGSPELLDRIEHLGLAIWEDSTPGGVASRHCLPQHLMCRVHHCFLDYRQICLADSEFPSFPPL